MYYFLLQDGAAIQIINLKPSENTLCRVFSEGFRKRTFTPNLNQIQKMNQLSLKSGVLALLFLTMFSCHDTGQDEFITLNQNPNSSEFDKAKYEKRLIEVSALIGSSLSNRDAMNELFSFSSLEGNAGDIGYSMKRLFDEKSTPFSKKKSAIYSAVNSNARNYRISGDVSNFDQLAAFISDNEIEILAPYLARNFKPEEINELTISWWTKEMEEEGLAKNPNWPGETPAFKIELDDSSNILDKILSSIQAGEIEIFMVGDAYAMENPTIVFGAFDEDLDKIGTMTKSDFLENKSFTNVVPYNVGVNCDAILPSDLVRYQMPDFRILDNTRSWPNGNFISIWVAYSAYNTSGGVPVLNFNVNQILNEKKISRGDFSWKSDWVPPLLTHWDLTNYSIQIVVAHEKSNITSTTTTSSVATNPTTGISATSSKTNTWSDTRIYGTNVWYRCQEINGAHTIQVPPTNQIRNGNAVWQMQSPEGRCEFTLEPRLTRW